MIYAVVVAAVLLTAAATAAIIRAERGPSMLDRTVAFDVFTTTLVAAVALEAAWSRRLDTLPLLVVLSLVGFVGSVTISRFASVEPEDAARVRTREEVEAERRAARAAELAAAEEARARREAVRVSLEQEVLDEIHDEMERVALDGGDAGPDGQGGAGGSAGGGDSADGAGAAGITPDDGGAR